MIRIKKLLKIIIILYKKKNPQKPSKESNHKNFPMLMGKLEADFACEAMQDIELAQKSRKNLEKLIKKNPKLILTKKKQMQILYRFL